MAQLALQYSALNHCATWEALTIIFNCLTALHDDEFLIRLAYLGDVFFSPE